MYRLDAYSGVIRLVDGALIPADPANTDYSAYLAWTADGNEPEPAAVVDAPALADPGPGDVIVATDFPGVDPTGVSDSTEGLRSWLSACAGKAGRLPAGDYLVSDFLQIDTNGTYIFGDGHATRVITNSQTADILRVGTTSDEVRGVTVRDIRFYATQVKTAGVAVRFRQASRCAAIGLRVSDFLDYSITGTRLYDGITWEAVADCVMVGCHMWGFKHDAVRVWGNASFNAELCIDGGSRIAGAERAGIACTGRFGGLRLSLGDVSGCQQNLRITQEDAPGFPNREVFVGPLMSLDSAADYNVFIGAQGLNTFEASGLWCASAGYTTTGGAGANKEGFHVDPNNAQLITRVTGGYIFNNKGKGAVFNGGKHFWTGVHFYTNGVDLGTGGHGLQFASSAGHVGPFSVLGCQFTNNSGSGVVIDVGLDNYHVKDNTFSGNGAIAIKDANSKSVTRQVRGNVGYVTEASGTLTVPSGSRQVTVNHGLSEAPNSFSFMALNTQQGSTWPYVDSITSTQFRFNLDPTATASAGRTYYWRASVYPGS